MSLNHSEFQSCVQVRPDDIDLFGHVHSAKYLDYFLQYFDIQSARSVAIPDWVIERYSINIENP
jgi:acyl-CoA thioesterase FadM